MFSTTKYIVKFYMLLFGWSVASFQNRLAISKKLNYIAQRNKQAITEMMRCWPSFYYFIHFYFASQKFSMYCFCTKIKLHCFFLCTRTTCFRQCLFRISSSFSIFFMQTVQIISKVWSNSSSIQKSFILSQS